MEDTSPIKRVKYPDGSVYNGQISKNGKRHGKGTLELSNGDKYEGEFQWGRRHGKGKFTYLKRPGCGGSYEGTFQLDLPHGTGMRVYANGNSFEGIFSRGLPNGQGVYRNVQGDVIVGSFENSIPAGHVLITYGNGDRFEGNVHKGVPFGRGVYVWSDGGFYDGEYIALKETGNGVMVPKLDGLQHGKGVRVWVSGNKYHGDWENGEIHGQGVFVTSAGERYEGTFVHGIRKGKGKCFYTCHRGSRYPCPLFSELHDHRAVCTYDGEWLQGVWHGKGKYLCADGRYYEGDFVYGKRHGDGVMTLIPSDHEGDRRRAGCGGKSALYRPSKYEGKWADNLMHGYGVWYFADGTRWKGDFFRGQLNGRVEVVFPSGRRRYASFRCGVRQKWLENVTEKDMSKLQSIMKFLRGPQTEEAIASRAAARQMCGKRSKLRMLRDAVEGEERRREERRKKKEQEEKDKVFELEAGGGLWKPEAALGRARAQKKEVKKPPVPEKKEFPEVVALTRDMGLARFTVTATLGTRMNNCYVKPLVEEVARRGETWVWANRRLKPPPKGFLF